MKEQLSFAFMLRARSLPLRKHTEEDIVDWIVRFNRGDSFQKIGEDVGVHFSTVFYHIKKRLGLSGRKVGRRSQLDHLSVEEKTTRTKDKLRSNHLLRKYGITVEEYDARYKEQEGKCAICHQPADKLCVDHCHATDEVRGLLCLKCNFAIGQLGDDPERLEQAAAYLRR